MSFEGLSPVAFESVSSVTATPSIDLGTERTVAGNKYVYVYNDANSTISIGKGCVLASSATGYSVTVSSATSLDQMIGVVKHADITTAAYGWVLTKGFATAQMLATSGSVSDKGLLELGANGLFAPVSNTTGNGPAVGKALAAIATGASGAAFFSVY